MGIRRGTMTDSPFVRKTSKQADRNFTGSITASNGTHSVSVYLQDGEVIGASSPGFEAPEGKYVLHRTGRHDLSRSATPLQEAYTSHDENGKRLIEIAEINDFRRDWAFGLIASVLTWDNPKVTEEKGATPPPFARIENAEWSEVKTSIDSRIQNTLMSWTTICRFIVEHDKNFPMFPASRGAGSVAAIVDGNSMFTGTESLDDVATRVGYSRYRVFRELAGILRSGGTAVRMGPHRPSADALPSPVLVPEMLEASDNEHVTEDKLRRSIAEETSDFSNVPLAESPQIEAAPVVPDTGNEQLGDLESVVSYEQAQAADFGIDLPEAEVELVPEAAPEPEPTPEPEPEPLPEPEPETTELTTRHDVHVLAQWSAHRDEQERQVRQSILVETIRASASKAESGLEELSSITEDFISVVDAQREAIARSRQAAEEFSKAESIVNDRQHEESETRVWAEQVMAEEARAVSDAQAAAEKVQATQESIDEARRVLAEREAALPVAVNAAHDAEAVADELRQRILSEVNPALSQAQAAVEQAKTALLNPATLRLGKAHEEVQARQADREAATNRVREKGTQVGQVLEMATTMAELDAQGADIVTPLGDRFLEIRDRFTAVESMPLDDDVIVEPSPQAPVREDIVDAHVVEDTIEVDLPGESIDVDFPEESAETTEAPATVEHVSLDKGADLSDLDDLDFTDLDES